MVELNDLDKKLLEHFRGLVVKKDLVLSIKGGANVPVFVLEYLIANSCSTDDDEKEKESDSEASSETETDDSESESDEKAPVSSSIRRKKLNLDQYLNK